MTKVSKFRCDDCNDCGKPIEFVKFVGDDYITTCANQPSYFSEVVLMQLSNGGKYDKMWAIAPNGNGVMYLGHWNDGFVEDKYKSNNY